MFGILRENFEKSGSDAIASVSFLSREAATLFQFRLFYYLNRLFRFVDKVEQFQLVMIDRAVRDTRMAFEPIRKRGPEILTHENDRDARVDFVGLPQSQKLKHLVEGAVAARKKHECRGGKSEHDLARKKIVEGD